jgi:hypothetical protein
VAGMTFRHIGATYCAALTNATVLASADNAGCAQSTPSHRLTFLGGLPGSLINTSVHSSTAPVRSVLVCAST